MTALRPGQSPPPVRTPTLIWDETLGAAAMLVGPGEEDDLALEVGEVLEALVDADEAEVGDLVEVAEAVEDGAADLFGRDVRAFETEALLDLDAERLEGLVADG